MKKAIAIMLTLTMAGISLCFPSNVSMVAPDAEDPITDEETIENKLEEDGKSPLENSSEEEEKISDLEEAPNNGDAEAEEPVENAVEEEKLEIVSLQVPQKIGIVVDPWELDERSQIYSEEYVIKNTGNVTGKLILTNFISAVKEPSEIVVMADRNGLHEGTEKLLYMEVVFGNGDKVICSREGSEYEVVLEPGEELTFRFSGEANENAASQWRNDDFGVTMAYSWDKEEMDTESEKKEEDEASGMDIEENESEGKDVGEEEPSDINESGNMEMNFSPEENIDEAIEKGLENADGS